MKKQIVLFGLGDLAAVAAVYFAQDSAYEVVAFTVNQQYVTDSTFQNLPVVPFEQVEQFYPPDRFGMFVAMGYKRVNRARATVYEACKQKGYELASYVHSGVKRWGDIAIGDNCLILDGNELNPFVRIGNDVLIWSGCHIGHHTEIGDHCFLCPRVVLPGRVKVGAYTFMGANVTIRDSITIAPHCFIGAGAVILKDTQEKGVYPARATEVAAVPSDEWRGL